MAGGVAEQREPAVGEAELLGSLVAALPDHCATAAVLHAAGPPTATIDGVRAHADAADADAAHADAAELARLLADRLAALEAGGAGGAR